MVAECWSCSVRLVLICSFCRLLLVISFFWLRHFMFRQLFLVALEAVQQVLTSLLLDSCYDA